MSADGSFARVVLACRDLAACQQFFFGLGFRVDSVLPADAPRRLGLSGHGLQLELELADADGGGHLRLPGSTARRQMAPNGAIVDFVPTVPRALPIVATFAVHRAADDWHTGRAGMLYRDLVPDRFGGAVIASHIRIPHGGPVPDSVHFHQIAAQVIYCVHGWVRLVYEDQGEPFVMRAGDCVLQPPTIRHRVLECSDGLEVVEVTTPAEHLTCFDHELTLPTRSVQPQRFFAGQRYCFAEAARTPWGDSHTPGWQQRGTGIGTASGGAIEVRVLRPEPGAQRPYTTTCPTLWFVLQGALTIAGERLERGEACVLPPAHRVELATAAADLELLEVALAAAP